MAADDSFDENGREAVCALKAKESSKRVRDLEVLSCVEQTNDSFNERRFGRAVVEEVEEVGEVDGEEFGLLNRAGQSNELCRSIRWER